MKRRILLAGVLAVAAALVVLVLTFQQGMLFNDPLAQWLRPLVIGMQ